MFPKRIQKKSLGHGVRALRVKCQTRIVKGDAYSQFAKFFAKAIREKDIKDKEAIVRFFFTKRLLGDKPRPPKGHMMEVLQRASCLFAIQEARREMLEHLRSRD